MVALPRLTLGTSGQRALLVHGLGSNGGTWWQLAERLVQEGWQVTMVDLRGHGGAPHVGDYTLDALAADLPVDEWDLVIGHSLGATASVIAAQNDSFTYRLVLLDPPLLLTDSDLDQIRAGEIAELTQTADELTAAHPSWHARDIQAKQTALEQVDPDAAGQVFGQNRPWNLLPEASALTVPTLIIGGDPAVFTMLPPEVGQRLARQNPLVRYTKISGSGHSPHREAPDVTASVLLGWLDEF
ncbi:alpha/beta hydrolase [Salinibacterium sp. ZJ454]|uniref:alpha/beta fold hydrolase n=1 Tax=Salinibacterium sp. ZJ454 TaxID=2708339 RepID=UPI001420B22D|nr:alpha/beta hydrolase [Salinibacterium sp. ZJ454]